MSKVHDKIYMDPIGGWDTKPIPDCVDNIYIRKDVLVDWLQRKQDTTLKVVEDDLIQEVIDHINKM